MPIRALNPTSVWHWFADICAIPHPTYHEAELAAFISRRAQEKGLSVRQDETGNLYVSKPAHGAGMAEKAGVILQAHIDMVAQKTPESAHDFVRDPIRPQIRDGWVYADHTTLGADNGIGAAMALAVLFADDIEHPPLEVLLTVEEEIGMGGVRGVRGDWLNGRYLLNLDTEENGSIYLGCAGGRDAEITLPLRQEAVAGERWRITVGGLRGGHSGIDIHRGRGNAITLLADTLHRLSGSPGWHLAAFQGGRLRNVIPREAVAEIVLPAGQSAALAALLQEAENAARDELGGHAAQLFIRAEAVAHDGRAFCAEDSRRAVALLCALPDGVLRWSDDFPGIVETSLCFSVAQSDAGQLHLCLLMRSLLESPKDALSRRLASVADLAGAKLVLAEDYPAWTPDATSRLFAATQEVFRAHFGCEPKVEVIHAGLECGLMSERLPQVEMVSFGPTIEDAHTPRERLHIDSVADCWQILLALLKQTP
ncbi:aminoacyl-histidine dipeptidase [Neisseria shayeganii]|uniref:Cytosol non-specific dipeptidase n=1 Tax=Neisseria shayeganii TaxID=607712 RepID=A0A7D7NCU7_9NEIS|nr:aminoacyl-histidine dipeptidase [Neisseria shayeganii]QMT41078.1 aminoacyl-histidine dipeptidase [Neisseria shayeganii]